MNKMVHNYKTVYDRRTIVAFTTNNVCMENSVCIKDYPKEFNNETKLSVNGCPQY